MISKDKQYRTRDGREVRIYATDGGSGSLVHGAIYTDGWQSRCWTKDGKYFSQDATGCDLIEVKPRIKRTVWLNVYENCVREWNTRETADFYRSVNRLACVKVEIDCEEGEGL